MGWAMVATCPGVSCAAGPSLPAATQPSAHVGAKPEEADETLGVATLCDQVVQVRERPRNDLDSLVLARLGLLVVEAGCQIQVALLRREAGRRVEASQVLPLFGALADLFRQL